MPGTVGEVWPFREAEAAVDISDGHGWGAGRGDTYGTWFPVADPGQLSSLCMRRTRNCMCPKQREDHIIAGRPWAGALLSLGGAGTAIPHSASSPAQPAQHSSSSSSRLRFPVSHDGGGGLPRASECKILKQSSGRPQPPTQAQLPAGLVSGQGCWAAGHVVPCITVEAMLLGIRPLGQISSRRTSV